jgi:hypothetical protein
MFSTVARYAISAAARSETAMRDEIDRKKKEGKRNQLIRPLIPAGLTKSNKSVVQPVIYLADA